MSRRTTLLAAVAWLLSGIALTLFFLNVAAIFGPINDLLISASLVLLVPGLWSARERLASVAAPWITLLTAVTTAGIAVAASGQVLLVLRIISLETSFVTGGLGFLPLVVWIGATSVIALRGRGLSRATGWWGVAFIGLTVVMLPLAWVVPMQLLALAGGIPWFLLLAGWMVSLSREFGAARREAVPAT